MVIVYEDQRSLRRAEKLQHHLSRRCNNELEITSSAWNFALLGSSGLRKRATSEALDGDMIVISARGGCELPEHLHAWLKRLISLKKGAHTALVVLLEPRGEDTSDTPTLTDSLRRMADASGLDFFCNRDKWQSQGLAPMFN